MKRTEPSQKSAVEEPVRRAPPGGFIADGLWTWTADVGSPIVIWLIGLGTTYFVALFTWAFLVAPGATHATFLQALNRFDTPAYVTIARHGYKPGDRLVAFYPLYPMLMRGLSLFAFRDLSAGHLLVCGLAISAGAFLLAIIALDRICGMYLDGRARQLCLVLWAFCPTAVFLSVGYSEALFMALVLGGFWRACKRDWLGAGALLGLACVTRPYGVVAYVAFLADYASQCRKPVGVPNPGPPRWALIGLALPALAIGAHLAYQGIALHDALASVHAEQREWHQYLLAPWNFPRYVAQIITFAVAMPGYDLVTAFSYLYLMASLVVSALVFTSPRMPFGFKVYTALIILSIVCRSSAMSIARFLMAAFPLFLALADWCARGSRTRAFLAVWIFAVLNVLGTILFVSGGPFF